MKRLCLRIGFLVLGAVMAVESVGYAQVVSPPFINKSFGVLTIPLNGTTTLTFSIGNPNSFPLTGVAFTDTLPAGLVVATPNGLTQSGFCSGGITTATAGSSTISLSSATLGITCTISVNVTGTTAGVKNNSVTVTSTNGGTGNTSNASITVVAPPRISKAFAATIPLNEGTALAFLILNPNRSVAFTGVAFTDTLPAGLVVATPIYLSNACGGTATATAGSGTISLSGGTLATNTACYVVTNVTGTTAGVKNNTTGNVTSTEGGTGNAASASVTVAAPPTISKAFNPSTIALNGTTSLTFTITNPNATVALAGVAFTDTLPTGLTVANSVATVCGGTLTTTAPTGIALSGASIAAASQCQFSVTVTGAALGNHGNTTLVVSSTNGGTGNTASANLLVTTPTPTPTPTNTPTNTPTQTSTSTPTGTPTPVPVVPTLNESGMLIFGLLIAGAGLLLVRRR